MNLVWFSLCVFIRSVICINESEVQNGVQRRYSVNHPPSGEENNPILVSVVNDDDVIEVKPHIPKYYDISLDREVGRKVSTTEGSQHLASKDTHEIKPKTEGETENILVRPTERALGEIHIPVAVIYDSVLDNTQNSRPVNQEETNIRRRKIKRVSRRKPLQNKTNAENENLTKQNTAQLKIENNDSDKSETSKTKPVKPQSIRIESAKPQVEDEDSVKTETPRTKTDKPHLSRTESAQSRIENDDSVKSETPRTKPVKPQLIRIESAKPQLEGDESVKTETPRTKTDKPHLSRTDSSQSQIENDDSVKSEIQRTKPGKPQLSRIESTKPQTENGDSVKYENQRTKPVKQQRSRTESAKPRIDNEDSVKSETQRTKSGNLPLSRIESAKPQINNDESYKSEIQSTRPAKPQLSITESAKPTKENEGSIKSNTRSSKTAKPQMERSESIKPRKIESARQLSSNVETTVKVEKAKRVRDPVIPIVEMENYVYGHNGNFHYSYEGGDGTKAHSEGQLRSIDDAAGEAVSGGFSYTDKDGNDFSVSYTADENGYRPIGAHLPTPPPIPPAIARALVYLATATTPEPVTKPSVHHARKSL